MGLLTLAGFFRREYGPTAELLSAASMVPSCFGWIAAQFTALAALLELFFGLDPRIGILRRRAIFEPGKTMDGRSRGTRRRRPARRARRFALVAALSALAAAPGAPAAGAEARADSERCAGIPADDLRRICKRGELLVARFRGERPPFFYRQGDEWVGFDVDLGRDIAQRLGVGYREVRTPASFNAVVEMVAAGGADIGLSKLSGTLERALKVRFTRPYLTVYQALVINRLSAPARGDPFRALDADGVAIGAIEGSSYIGFARENFRSAEIRPYTDSEFSRMMGDVVSRQLDAVLLDSARADVWRRGHRESLIRVRTTVDRQRRDPLAIAVASGDVHLLAWLDLYLETIRADGSAERLYRRWFGEGGEAAAAAAGESEGEGR